MKMLLLLVVGILMSACGAKHKTEAGLTAKTYDKKFTKNTAQNYAYRFGVDNISYIDRDGRMVNLTDEQKQQVVTNVNQCLNDAGYASIITNPQAPLNMTNPSKTILLNLKFKETTTDDEELFYGQAMAEEYPNYDYKRYEEQGIGPQNRSVIPYGLTYASDTLFQNRHAFSNKNYAETLFNYVGNDKVYYITYPHYSVYAGLEIYRDKLDTNCQRRYTPIYEILVTTSIMPFACRNGTTSLSNFYATLTGTIGTGNKQFETTLHYKTNFLKKEDDLEKTREHIIDFLSKNICLFITDNVDDLGIKFANPITDNNAFYSHAFEAHQIVKNKSLKATGNYYTIKNRNTGEVFSNTERNGIFKGGLYKQGGIRMMTGCSSKNGSDSSGNGVSIQRNSDCFADLQLRKLDVNIDDLEIKNNLKKEDE